MSQVQTTSKTQSTTPEPGRTVNKRRNRACGVRGNFVLLCQADSRSSYDARLKSEPHDFTFVDNLDDLLAHCVEHGPSAALVDIGVMARLGPAATKPLFEIGMDWPVIRCALNRDGNVNVMCSNTSYCGPLSEALDAIASQTPEWRAGRRHRRFLRVEVRCRAKLRVLTEHIPRPANITQLSIGGAFVVTYDPPAEGSAVEVEIFDLGEEAFTLQATVVWSRNWDDGPETPGAAITFDPLTVHQAFRRAVARPEHIARLRKR